MTRLLVILICGLTAAAPAQTAEERAAWRAQMESLWARHKSAQLEENGALRQLVWKSPSGSVNLSHAVQPAKTDQVLSPAEVEALPASHPLYSQRRRIAAAARGKQLSVRIIQRSEVEWNVSRERGAIAILESLSAAFALGDGEPAGASSVRQKLTCYKASSSRTVQFENLSLGDGDRLSLCDVSEDGSRSLAYQGDSILLFGNNATPLKQFSRKSTAQAGFVSATALCSVGTKGDVTVLNFQGGEVRSGLSFPEGYNRLNCFLREIDGSSFEVVKVSDGSTAVLEHL